MSLQQEVQKIEQANRIIQNYLPKLRKPKLVRKVFLRVLNGVILSIPVAFFLSNFLFDLYYFVPEIPKYVKVSGSEIALQVNTKINSTLEKEATQKFKELNPKGGIAGVITNQKTSKTEDLCIQGSLTAVKTNTAIGKVTPKPIYFSTAYQKGIQSSYNMGKKYYDLEFDLKVNGSEKGLIANKIGTQKAETLNLFTSSLEIIEEADQILNIDLQQFLNQSTDREESLRSYLTYLRNAEKNITNAQTKVAQEIKRLDIAEKEARKKMENTESKFFTALNKFDQNTTHQNLDQFIQDYQVEVDKKANLQAMHQVDKYFQFYQPLLTKRLEAVEINRNALVHGIKVVAYRDLDLGIVKVAD